MFPSAPVSSMTYLSLALTSFSLSTQAKTPTLTSYSLWLKAFDLIADKFFSMRFFCNCVTGPFFGPSEASNGSMYTVFNPTSISSYLWFRLQNPDCLDESFVTGISPAYPEICLKRVPRELLFRSSAICTTLGPIKPRNQVVLLELLPKSNS